MRCKEEEAERQGLWDESFGNPGMVCQSEESPATRADVREAEKDEVVPLRRRKSSNAHITMRYQNRLDILEWRQALPTSATTQLSAASAVAKPDCESVDRNDCFAKRSSEATTTRNGSRASLGSSITLNTQQEQVFFDKVRKELPATQRSIDDEVLRCMDRLREHCDCITCVKWRALKSEIKEQADREDGWKASWRSVLRRKSSIIEAGAGRYGAHAWSQMLEICRTQR